MTPELGDRVRIVDNPATRSSGHARREGLCYGFTTPSITDVEVIGNTDGDIAFSVSIDGMEPGENWFGPDSVEVIDHSPGLVIGVGENEFIRTEQGGWERLAANRDVGRVSDLWSRLFKGRKG